jgi:iron(III) transport system substrate-binding protein
LEDKVRKNFFVLAALCCALLSLAVTGCKKARQEGGGGSAGGGELGGTLVLYSTQTENDISNLLKGFGAKYPGITVEVVNGSAGELTSRIAAEKDNPQGDLMWGGITATDGDAYSDLFEHWLSDYEDEIMEDYRSPNGFYNLFYLSTTVFCVNTDLEKELGLDIKGYADLLNPKLRGRIVLSDPNSSSAAWSNVSNIMAVFGHDSPAAWTYIENLLKNGLTIVTSSSVCFKAVADGEYVVGMTYEDGALTLLKSGAKNVRLVFPEEGTSAFAFSTAVIKGAKHPEAAKVMINYIMSAEGQTFLGTAGEVMRLTNKNASYKSPYLKDNAEIKWVKRDIPWLIANKAQVLEHWNGLVTSIKR